jgi:hypothetical protein
MMRKTVSLSVILSVITMLLAPMAALADDGDPVGLFGEITSIDEATGEFTMVLGNGQVVTFPADAGGLGVGDIKPGDNISGVGYQEGDGYQPGSDFFVKPAESQYTHQPVVVTGEGLVGTMGNADTENPLPME